MGSQELATFYDWDTPDHVGTGLYSLALYFNGFQRFMRIFVNIFKKAPFSITNDMYNSITNQGWIETIL